MTSLVGQTRFANLLLITRSKTLDAAYPILTTHHQPTYPMLKRHQQTAAKSVENDKPDRSVAKTSKSFCFNVFQGELVNDQVFPYPDILTGQQKEQLSHMVDHFSALGQKVLDPLKNDETGEVPAHVMKAVGEQGAFGIQVPKEYGGKGLNNTMAARLGQIVGGIDLGMSAVMGAHQAIGYKGIVLVGTEEQKRKYVPALATGEKLAAFCLTEPGSGSDANSIKTRAVLNSDGTHFILNGSKIWITGGGLAEVFTVFCKTPILDPETGVKTDKMTALIVERAFGGVTSGSPNKKMGIKCSNTTEVYFDNVMVPVENVLLEPGKGFKVAMRILNGGRFGMGAALSGCMRTAISQAAEHTAISVSRPGRPVRAFSSDFEKLSWMSIHHYVTESLAYVVAANMDSGAEDYHLETAVSKIFASESAWKVVDDAIQLVGGEGYMREAGLEKRLRDLRIFRIFEGTNDILRLFIALSGLQFAGTNLRQIVKNVTRNPLAHPDLIVKEGKKRTLRILGVNASGAGLESVVHSDLRTSARKIGKAVDSFGLGSEAMLRKYGKAVIDEQFRLKRLADCLTDLYTSACVLSRATKAIEEGSSSATHQTMMTKLWCNAAYDRIVDNLAAIEGKNGEINFSRMKEISDNVVAAGGVVQGHPLGV